MYKSIALLLVAGLAFASCSKKQDAAAPASTAAPAATSSASTTTYAVTPDPYAAATFTDAKLQSGHDVFQKWCAPCHAPGPGHPGTQALAVKYKGSDTPAALEERTNLDPDTLKTFVRGGVSVMPPFRKTEITDTELDALAAYIARPR